MTTNRNTIARYTEYEKPVLASYRESVPDELVERFILDYGIRVLSPFYETMIEFLAIGDYVYACSVERGGIVEEIVRDSEGFPLCVRIKCDRDTHEYYGTDLDYVSVERITYWDKWKDCRDAFRDDELWDEKYFTILERDIEDFREDGLL